jgi:hypothetical protein
MDKAQGEGDQKPETHAFENRSRGTEPTRAEGDNEEHDWNQAEPNSEGRATGLGPIRRRGNGSEQKRSEADRLDDRSEADRKPDPPQVLRW